ncbi:MAG TPA: citrate/2-methylcitrate synthase [Vicinamibacterales bacterium]|jgi:citrate synthase|nr:citrate/2-methylcitrate synthase [Vicinamibacterales bacterium]
MKAAHSGTAPVWMRAADAAGVLRVSRATLYAYVSRGYIRSQAMPGSSRERGYSRDDVERLRRRTEERRDPDKAAAGALHWGVPILESSITLIDGRHLYYRGQDAVGLARSRSLKEVASLIWTGRFDAALSTAPDGMDRADTANTADTANRAPAGERRLAARLPFVARAQSALAVASARDPLAFDVRPGRVAPCGWRILHLLARAVTRSRPEAPTIDQSLARAWGVSSRGVDLLRSALILCADHELNVSSFTARSVASAGSNPYAVVIAGLAALEGTRHGGASARVESMLASERRARDLRSALAARLRRGERIDGFGHPLYPSGDPRAAMLIEGLRAMYAKSAELAFVLSFAEAATSAIREEPNIDFALAALGSVLGLPSGSPLALFAIGRAVGWIGHAIEQYATGQLIRPRAKYVGVVPGGIIP